ncbi:hypothetical protein IQ07DRAFT_24952 [Pyrenochaeta sp. DS3sAY3a]|nr:hypothetical protein IQ07DRAFT_24952 [Pyrenochaeta sp. DS3sAY3a]
MIATDMVLYGLPISFTWKLHLRRAPKIGLNILFGLGLFVLAASGARAYAGYTQMRRPDITYHFGLLGICSVVECHLGIIVACAPSIKVVVLRAILQRLKRPGQLEVRQGTETTTARPLQRTIAASFDAQLRSFEAASVPSSSRYSTCQRSIDEQYSISREKESFVDGWSRL